MERDDTLSEYYRSVNEENEKQIRIVDINSSITKNKEFNNDNNEIIPLKFKSTSHNESSSTDKYLKNNNNNSRSCRRNSLMDKINCRRKEEKDIPNDMLLFYCYILVSGLEYLHSNDIIPKILTPEYFILENNTLVIDISYDNRCNENDYLYYSAPENLFDNELEYTVKSNIYSLGCIFYELYSLKKVNDGCKTKESRLLKKVEFSRYKLPRNTKIESLILKMLNQLKDNRINLKRVKELINSIQKSYVRKEDDDYYSDYEIPSVDYIYIKNSISEENDIIKSLSDSDSIIKSISSSNNSNGSRKYIHEISEYEKENITDSNIIKFYQGEYSFKGMNISDYRERNINYIDFYKYKEFFFPHLKQDKLILNESTIEKFQSNHYIRNRFLSMIDLAFKKYGYKCDGLVLAKDYSNSHINIRKDEIIPLFEHIKESIKDLYKENNNGYYMRVMELIEDRMINIYIISRIEEYEDFDLYDEGEYNSLTVSFYLQGRYIGGKSLKEISQFSETEFCEYWCNDDLISIFFPTVNQENPAFSLDDLMTLKENKESFIYDLHNIIELLKEKLKHDKKDVKLYLHANVLPFLRLIGDDDSNKLMEESIKELSNYKIDSVSSFLLDNSESKDGLTLEKLVSLNQEEFNSLNTEKYIPYIFPCVGQNNPKFTHEDLEQLRKYKGNCSLYKPIKEIVEKLLRKFNINVNSEKDEIMVRITDIDENQLENLSDILKRGLDFHSEIESDVDLILYLKNIMNQLDRIVYSTKDYNNGNDRLYEKIGKGGFGVVYKVEHNGIIMARKDIEIDFVNIDKVINEINIMKDMRNTNVLKCYDQVYDRKNSVFHIYTQYFKYDLSKKIKEMKRTNKHFSVYKIVCFMRNLINGINYIHSKGIIHRDLKPSNIFVDESGKLVIGDFGLAIDSYTKDNRLLGSLSYIAPELWEIKPPKYSVESDIFALGCILYEIYTLRKAFKGDYKTEIKNRIISSTRIIDFSGREESSRNYMIEGLINNMLKKNARERVDLEYISEILDKISPIVDFYLENKSCNECRIEDVYVYNDIEKFCRYNLLVVLFPEINQDNPPFTESDAEVLIKNEYYFIEKYRIIVGNMCRLIIAEGGLENVIQKYSDSIKENVEQLINRFQSFTSILGDSEVSELIKCLIEKGSDNKRKHII